MQSGAHRLGKELLQSGVGNYKVGQLLLQSGAGITKWGKYITSWGNYYQKGLYTFVTLGRLH